MAQRRALALVLDQVGPHHGLPDLVVELGGHQSVGTAGTFVLSFFLGGGFFFLLDPICLTLSNTISKVKVVDSAGFRPGFSPQILTGWWETF